MSKKQFYPMVLVSALVIIVWNIIKAPEISRAVILNKPVKYSPMHFVNPLIKVSPIKVRNFASNNEVPKALLAYSNYRKSLVFMKEVERYAQASFRGIKMLDYAEEMLLKSRYEEWFNIKTEQTRMAILDYLGDVILGNITYEDSKRALNILMTLLNQEITKEVSEKRLIKSWVGDKSDALAILTQFDKRQALSFLEGQRNSRFFKNLSIGYLNGLFFSGVSSKNVKKIETSLNAMEFDYVYSSISG